MSGRHAHLPRCTIPVVHRGVGVEEKRRIGIDQRQMTQGVGHGCGEPVPFLRKDAPDIARDPFDLTALVHQRSALAP